MKIATVTLGCKVNQSESSALAELFCRLGYTVADTRNGEIPDVCIVNSCAVTAESERKSRGQLSRLRRAYPNAILVLCGCMAQISKTPERFNADIVVGTAGRSEIPRLVQEFAADRARLTAVTAHTGDEKFEPLSPETFESRTRAFLKIEDGCDRFCSYCIIPYARGRVRSMPLNDITDRVASLTACGHCETVLTGINLAAYGDDLGLTLNDAVDAASRAGCPRIRLGSLECDLMTDDFLHKLAAEKAFCPQFHLSLQSGCDSVLKRMNRRYTAAQYLALTQKIRTMFENPAFTTDVMVGFAGETEAEFEQSMQLCREVGFAKLHVFPYSVRPGTPAADMPQVDAQTKKRRAEQAAAVGAELAAKFARSQVGSTAQVLFETKCPGGWFGRSANYAPVVATCDSDPTHRIMKVEITDSDAEMCLGRVIQ